MRPNRTPRYLLDARMLNLPPHNLPTDLGNGLDFVLDGFELGRWHYLQMLGDIRLTVQLPEWKETAS